jgi:lysine 2,3-aminomutase
MPGVDAAALAQTEDLYRFRAPSAYLELIDPTDPDDPIRKLVIPDARELAPLRSLDPTQEASFTPVPGLQHKFSDTALLLVTANCAAYCRYCFRKRLFQPSSEEVPRTLLAAVNYIKDHPEINNVILSGGDAFSLPTPRLIALIESICSIDTVRVIRIGSKTPAFDPTRILRDTQLLETFQRLSSSGKQFYLMAHFDHPREVTGPAIEAVRTLARAGLTCLNQCPLIDGVNSAEGVLSELFDKMAFIGCPQYYVFHCRPTDGNGHFILPLGEAFAIFERESRYGSGLSKTARYCVAHPSGKLQVLAMQGHRVLLRYLQACDPSLTGTTFWHTASESLDDISLEANISGEIPE